jgi:hypothetical protein
LVPVVNEVIPHASSESEFQYEDDWCQALGRFNMLAFFPLISRGLPALSPIVSPFLEWSSPGKRDIMIFHIGENGFHVMCDFLIGLVFVYPGVCQY